MSLEEDREPVAPGDYRYYEPAKPGSLERSVVPRRRFGIRLEGGGDSPEEVIDLLRHMADEMEMNPGTISSTVGGCGHGGHYDVEDRGAHITPASFRADLKAWMESKRHNAKADLPPTAARQPRSGTEGAIGG